MIGRAEKDVRKLEWLAYHFSDARWGGLDFDAAVDHC